MKYAWTFILLCLFGCGISPKETQQSQTVNDTARVQAAQNADLHQHIAAPPPQTIETTTNPKTGEVHTTITPAAGAVDTHYRASGSVNADTEIDSTWAWMETIPMGVKLIFLGIAIVLFLAIWSYVRRTSVAAAATATAADDALASLIHNFESRAMTATSPTEINAHLSAAKELEKRRGQLKAKKK